MIEGFLGFDIFDFGIFFGWNILQVFLGGIQNNLKIGDSSHVSRPRSSANRLFGSNIQDGISEG